MCENSLLLYLEKQIDRGDLLIKLLKIVSRFGENVVKSMDKYSYILKKKLYALMSKANLM